MRVLGVDPSLTATGIARPDGSCLILNTKLRGAERLAWLRDAVEIHVLSADIIMLEGYAFARPNQAHQIGEWGGVLRLLLHESGVPWVEVPPKKLKKFATGSGNAEKGHMLSAAIQRLGYTGHSNDEADALWLREMALQHYGCSPVTLPAAQLAALAGIAWPAGLRGGLAQPGGGV